MDDELTLVFERPIAIGPQTWEQVTLTQPEWGQIKAARRASADPAEQQAHLVHVVGKIPMAVVDKMTQRDIMRAFAFFARFSDLPPVLTPSDSAT